jgi:putative membrane protein
LHEPMMGLWGWVGCALMVIFWAVGTVAVVLWVKSWLEQQGLGSASCAPGSALEILKQRYACGEINKQEFEEQRKDLL